MARGWKKCFSLFWGQFLFLLHSLVEYVHVLHFFMILGRIENWGAMHGVRARRFKVPMARERGIVFVCKRRGQAAAAQLWWAIAHFYAEGSLRVERELSIGSLIFSYLFLIRRNIRKI